MVASKQEWLERETSDPRKDVAHVYRYLNSLWGFAVTRDQRRRAKNLKIAMDTLATEWPEALAMDEEA